MSVTMYLGGGGPYRRIPSILVKLYDWGLYTGGPCMLVTLYGGVCREEGSLHGGVLVGLWVGGGSLYGEGSVYDGVTLLEPSPHYSGTHSQCTTGDHQLSESFYQPQFHGWRKVMEVQLQDGYAAITVLFKCFDDLWSRRMACIQWKDMEMEMTNRKWYPLSIRCEFVSRSHCCEHSLSKCFAHQSCRGDNYPLK